MAKTNIKNGPIIHVIKNDRDNNFMFLKTFGISENLTFTKGGYIINISPMAKGILVDPLENDCIKPALDGIK